MRTPILSVAALAWLVGCERSGEATVRAQAPVGDQAPAADPIVEPIVGEAPAADAPPQELPSDQPQDDADDDGQLEAEPDSPEPPADYGLIHPPIDPPSDDALVLHALAGFEVVAVYAKPDLESPRLGYLRLGARMKVTKSVEGSGCPKGWHALPNGGFACAGKGLTVGDKEPFMRDPPPPPALDEPLPYEYAKVHRWNTPMYWRVPKPEEQRAAEQQRALLEAQREGRPPPSATATATASASKPSGDDAAASKLPSIADDEPSSSSKPEPSSKGEPSSKSEPAAKSEPAVPEPPIKLPLNPQTPWLERGFYVSLGGKVTEEGRTWWRTARGAFVPAADVHKYTPKDFVGVELHEDSDFPFGWAMAEDTKVYTLTDDGKLKAGGKVARRTFLDLSEETEIGGKAYMMTTEGTLVRKADIRIAERQPLPKGLQPWERWIDVDLDQQMLVAYEGERPVYVTLVSSGRKGTKEEPFDTPTGRWRIRSKHISSTMDGPTASDGNYSIQDVPWTMFFEGSYALHGAFWHDGFGRVRSHGCVNLGPSDARWLFNWTTPFLPEGWHGVHAHEGSPGTTVIIRKQ